MNVKKENPIAVQSKRWLLAALLDLMEKDDFHSITITQLTQHAGLDRKTFYRNFHTKEDVLNLKLQELFQCYLKSLQTLSQLSAYTVSKAYFDICTANIHFLKLLNRQNLLPLALSKFNEYLPVLNDVFRSVPAYRNKSKYELFYQAGGFWNVTIQWLHNGGMETAEELADIISSIMPAVLDHTSCI